jgi:hypothetical protein
MDMRIFKQLRVDFKSSLLFKNTLEYIECVFEKLGITYNDMGFMCSGGSDADKIAAKYPALAKYIKPGDEHDGGEFGAMSSAQTDKSGSCAPHIDVSEHQILRELVKKIPNPYNLGAFSVFLDNVRWFPDINTAQCLDGRYAECPIPPNANYPYMSNRVILEKCSSYGTKHNPVKFIIEAGNEKSGIIYTTDLEEKLSAALGKQFLPFEHGLYNGYRFCFNDREIKHLTEAGKAFDDTYDPFIKKITASVNNAKGIQHLREYPRNEPHFGFSRVSGLSLANAFRKTLPPKQYKMHGGAGKLFTVERKNEHNHTFKLECDLTPVHKIFRAEMCISGYNFKHKLLSGIKGVKKGFTDIYPNTQEEVKYHTANLAAALIEAEEQLSGELLRLYGKSLV